MTNSNQKYYSTKKYGCVWSGLTEDMDPQYEYSTLTKFHRLEKCANSREKKLARSYKGM